MITPINHAKQSACETKLINSKQPNPIALRYLKVYNYFFSAMQSLRKVLKAQLYSILPTSNIENPLPELTNLSKILNGMLEARGIAVEVHVSDPKQQYHLLYDPHRINEMFTDFDIIEIDAINLWAIQEKLMTFTRHDIPYYHKMFPFEWEPLSRVEHGQELLIGSPALLCSDFIQKREGPYEDQIYAFIDDYMLGSIYLNYFINQQSAAGTQAISSTTVDENTIQEVASLLKNLKRYDQKVSFFDTKAAYTLGFSENLLRFQSYGYSSSTIKLEHVARDKLKKIVYIDALIAKHTPDPQDRQTVLQFYEFMVSDEVLEVYTQGLYTLEKRRTFIMPPTVDYFEKVAGQDEIYRSILEMVKQSAHYPACHEHYARSLKQFTPLIATRLKQLNVDL